MRTARSLIISPYLIVSHAPSPQEQPCMPPGSNHARPPGATTHTPQATMHTPPQATTHAPLSNHPCPLPPEQPCTPPWATTQTPSRATTHAPPPQSNHACPPVNRMTNWCKNITLPQTSFVGGKNSYCLRIIIMSWYSKILHMN